jgi:hypothetical protein
MKTTKTTVVAALLALSYVVVLAAGMYVGYFKIPQPHYPDPQTLFETVHTPREAGTDAYVAWASKRCRGGDMLVAIYTLTNSRVVDTWVELKTNHRTNVRVVLDLSESRAVESEKDQIKRLDEAGIPYRIGHSPKGSAIMHDKFTACNGEWVEDGSWNYTDAADDQANTLNFNIVPSPLRYAKFDGEWRVLWDNFGEQEIRRANRGKKRPRAQKE